MTTRVIKIVVDSTGAKRGSRDVQKSLAGVDKQAKETTKGVSTFNKALIAGAVVFAAAKVIELGDAYAQLRGSLRLVTDSQTELDNVTQSLFDISQRTRQELGATADLYIRLGRSTDFSNERILQLTETIGQTIALSRATPQAAQAALFQLGQGFAAGALRGEELNSVLEQTPELAKAIADGLDITIAGLRELGAEGKLTAELVAQALEKSAGRVAEEFNTVPLTVGDAVTKIGNSILLFVGRLDEATGATALLAKGLNGVAETIQGLAILVGEDKGFGVAAARLGERIEATRVLKGEIERLLNSRAIQRLGPDDFTVVNLNRELDAANEKLKELIQTQQQVITNKGLTDAELAVQKAKELAEEEEKARIAAAAAAVARQEEANKFAEGFDTAVDKAQKQLEVLNQFVAEGFLGPDIADKIAANLDDIINPLTEIEVNIELRQIDDASRAFLDAIENAENLEEQLRAFSTGGQDALDATIAFQEAEAIIEATGITAGVTAEELAKVIAKEKELADALAEATSAQEEQEDAFNDFLTRARENSQDVLAGFLADPLGEGLDELPSKFAKVLNELAAQALAAEIFKLLGNIGSGGGNPFLSAIGSFFGGAQEGADVSGGDFGVVGESGPEVFQAPTAGRIVPNGQAAAPQVSVGGPTIVNTLDDGQIVAAFNRGGGDEAILNFIGDQADAVRQTLGIQ